MKRRIVRVLVLGFASLVLFAGAIVAYLYYCGSRSLHEAQTIRITQDYFTLPPPHKPPVTVTITDPQTIREFFALYDSEVATVTPYENDFRSLGNLLGNVPTVEFEYGPMTIDSWRFLNRDVVESRKAKVTFKSEKVFHQVLALLNPQS